MIQTAVRSKTAAPDVAADAHRFIRTQAKISFGAQAANNIRMLYGGSVEPENAKSLMAPPEIDGFLVGGASLYPACFEIDRESVKLGVAFSTRTGHRANRF